MPATSSFPIFQYFHKSRSHLMKCKLAQACTRPTAGASPVRKPPNTTLPLYPHTRSHLVKRNPTVNHRRGLLQRRHPGVHLRAHQPERHRLYSRRYMLLYEQYTRAVQPGSWWGGYELIQDLGSVTLLLLSRAPRSKIPDPISDRYHNNISPACRDSAWAPIPIPVPLPAPFLRPGPAGENSEPKIPLLARHTRGTNHAWSCVA